MAGVPAAAHTHHHSRVLTRSHRAAEARAASRRAFYEAEFAKLAFSALVAGAAAAAWALDRRDGRQSLAYGIPLVSWLLMAALLLPVISISWLLVSVVVLLAETALARTPYANVNYILVGLRNGLSRSSP